MEIHSARNTRFTLERRKKEMKKYFTADPHFGHANMIRLPSRLFTDGEEMDKVLVRNWNSTVKREDEIYIIGDFSWY